MIVIKCRRMKLAGHAARMGWRELLIKLWSGDLKVIDHVGDISVDGKVTLNET